MPRYKVERGRVVARSGDHVEMSKESAARYGSRLAPVDAKGKLTVQPKANAEKPKPKAEADKPKAEPQQEVKGDAQGDAGGSEGDIQDGS